MFLLLSDWAKRVGGIGDRADDPENVKLQHRFLVWLAILMSIGGILWGTISAAFGLYIAAAIPYGYTVLSAVNLATFRATRNFGPTRNFQVFISLLLPFLFQLSLGGFAASGGVMLWAMLAIVGSLTFTEPSAMWKWLGIYLASTILVGVLDPAARSWSVLESSADIRVAFFVTNIVFISAVVFGLMIYMTQRQNASREALEVANVRIVELNQGLEDQVADRTRALRGALAERQALIDSLGDGLVAVDANHVIRTANPALVEQFGIVGETEGRPLSEGLPDLATAIAEASQGLSMITADLVLTGDRIGRVSASPIHADGEAQGVVALIRDVTLEREIDRMKTDFIATVSHELRTPLTSVLGFAKISKSRLESKVFPTVPEDDKRAQRAVEQVRGNLGIIVSEGERLTALINDVLDISKMEAGRMEWEFTLGSMADLLQRAADATSPLFQDAVTFRLEVADELPRVRVDSDRMLQLLINLISNAAKFTSEGEVVVGAKRAFGGIEVYVEDSGIGIPKVEQATIFEKFRQVGDTLTNRPTGTGLGLPICQQIARAHEAELHVESEEGRGSRFFFVLPLDVSRQERTREPGVDSVIRRIDDRLRRAMSGDEGAEILVVDDDANLRELLRQQLTEKGYHVRSAANGYEAIAEIRKKQPSLVILDLMMPDLSGFDVAAMLKNDPQTAGLPILVLSIVKDTERGLKLGIDRYLSKPAEPEDITAAVEELLQEGTSPRRVLMVDESQPTSSALSGLLEAQGFEIVGVSSGPDALQKAKETEPDLILLERLAENGELIRTIRFEKGLENVVIVQVHHDEGVSDVS